MPAAGVLTLHIGEHEVGSGRIRTQPGKFSIGGEGLNIGKDGAEPVTDDYPGAYRGPSPAAPSTKTSSTSRGSRSSTWPPSHAWRSCATDAGARGAPTRSRAPAEACGLSERWEQSAWRTAPR